MKLGDIAMIYTLAKRNRKDIEEQRDEDGLFIRTVLLPNLSSQNKKREIEREGELLALFSSRIAVFRCIARLNRYILNNSCREIDIIYA
jgi:hypothetical protein